MSQKQVEVFHQMCQILAFKFQACCTADKEQLKRFLSSVTQVLFFEEIDLLAWLVTCLESAIASPKGPQFAGMAEMVLAAAFYTKF